MRRSHRGRIACQADARVSKPPPDGASSARSKCARQDRGGRQARRQNTPRRTGQRLGSFAKRANKTRQRANTATLVGWLVSQARRNRARGTQTNRKHVPTLPSPSFFPLRAFLLLLLFLFFSLFPFRLSGLGLTFQQGPGASFSVCLPHLESVRHVRTGLVQQHDPPMLLPLSLEVFIQPKGIVPESAVLVRSFSLVFSYLCTQRCGHCLRVPGVSFQSPVFL